MIPDPKEHCKDSVGHYPKYRGPSWSVFYNGADMPWPNSRHTVKIRGWTGSDYAVIEVPALDLIDWLLFTVVYPQREERHSA